MLSIFSAFVLFCVARAFLQNAKIIIFDEATAAIDTITEGKLQESIRKIQTTRKITTITIAHRIGTIMDSDRILILGAGQVLEFDTPEKLLNDKDSELCKLINV